LRWASVSASIRSATPSAWARVELAVLEGAAGELARFGQAQTQVAHSAASSAVDDGAAAVHVKLGAVFAGIAAGPSNRSTRASSRSTPAVAQGAENSHPDRGRAGRREGFDHPPVAGPESRTTATAARPAAVAAAKIVSFMNPISRPVWSRRSRRTGRRRRHQLAELLLGVQRRTPSRPS
jgi:hypothetical protein